MKNYCQVKLQNYILATEFVKLHPEFTLNFCIVAFEKFYKLACRKINTVHELHSKILEKTFGNRYNKFVSFLTNKNYINRTNKYITGVSSKIMQFNKGYVKKITNSSLILILINDKRLRDAIVNFYTDIKNISNKLSKGYKELANELNMTMNNFMDMLRIYYRTTNKEEIYAIRKSKKPKETWTETWIKIFKERK